LKSLVSLVFQTSLMQFVEAVRDDLTAVGVNVGEVKSVIQRVEESHRAHMQEIESLHANLNTLGFCLKNAGSDVEEIKTGFSRFETTLNDHVFQTQSFTTL